MSHICNGPSGDVLGDTELIFQTEALGGPKGQGREGSVHRQITNRLFQ